MRQADIGDVPLVLLQDRRGECAVELRIYENTRVEGGDPDGCAGSHQSAIRRDGLGGREKAASDLPIRQKPAGVDKQ